MRLTRAIGTVATSLVCLAFAGCARDARTAADAGSSYDRRQIERVMNAREDVLGGGALKQPGGPSYEYFRDLMPPLRYVEANFKHYPIVLSAPGATVKGRLVSNGSAVNA